MAAKVTVQTIPVIFVGVQDPVGIGLVPSLGRPGGNITGFSQAEEEGLVGKRLELFREAVPPVERLALMWNPAAPGVSLRLKEAQNAGARFNVTVRPFEVREAKELDGIFTAISKEHLTRLGLTVPRPVLARADELIQ